METYPYAREAVREAVYNALSEIADRLGVSYKTVQRTVADLKRGGAIEKLEEEDKDIGK